MKPVLAGEAAPAWRAPVALAAHARDAALGGLGGVDGGVRRCVEHDGVLVPRPGRDGLAVGQVERGDALAGEEVDAVGARVGGVQGAAELTERTDDERLLRCHRRARVERRGVLVLLADDRLGQRDRPVDRRGGVAQRERGVGHPGAPVVVDEVGVGRRVLEHLVAVADAAGHEDRDRGVHLEREGRAEGLALAHVDPRAEDPAGRERDELVPRLGVDAARDAAVGVEGDVVLDRAEVGQADGQHLLPLPVLLEEPAVVVAAVEAYDDEARDRRLLQTRQRLERGKAHWPFSAYFASTASLWGRHQSSWVWYHSMVLARPDSKSWNCGDQPSSWRSLPDSMA